MLCVKLPSDYRDFLLTYGGYGGSLICPSVRPEAYPDGAWLGVFFGFYEGDTTYHLPYVVEAYRERIPKRLVPIAGELGGSNWCISVSGKDQGSIYYWDVEEETISPTMANCIRAAKSFDAFIRLLRPRFG